MNDLTIRQIINQVNEGQLRVPSFQRGFVWDASRVAFLMDSIYKSYPIGSILIWRTKEKLDFERKVGPFLLPDPKADFPIDYLLDGQQRVTALFGVFQTEIKQEDDPDWMNIYFNLQATDDAQESRFVALESSDVDHTHYFPLRSLFDSVVYREATSALDNEKIKQVDALQTIFKEARIPVQMLTTDDKTTVAIVFERVNQRGVPLDTLQLLTAWTWSQEFLLEKEFEELSEELEPFGFNHVGEDQNLLLRCCAAVLANNASIDTLMKLNGRLVRDKFELVTNGLKGAIDFLRSNLTVYNLSNLPYTALLIPLCVFYANEKGRQVKMTNEQRRIILRWFWKVCFSRRYNSQPVKTLQADVEAMIRLKNGQSTDLGRFTMSPITPEYFINELFRAGNVATKTFILLLANQKPRSFISGTPISLDKVLKEYNRNEFHHLYPRAFVKELDWADIDVNALANFCILSRVDNNALSGDAPSIYRDKMPKDSTEILISSLVPANLFDDDFEAFIGTRARLLAEVANSLIN